MPTGKNGFVAKWVASEFLTSIHKAGGFFDDPIKVIKIFFLLIIKDGRYSHDIQLFSCLVYKPKMVVSALYMTFFFTAVKHMDTIWIVYLDNNFMIRKMSIKPS